MGKRKKPENFNPQDDIPKSSVFIEACKCHIYPNANSRHFFLVPPRIVHITSSQILEEGANVTLSCQASGVPSPVIRWSKAYGRIPEDRSIERLGELTISKITMAENGYYVCEVDNILGKKISRVQIMVFEVLKFKIKPLTESRHKYGETVAIHCKASGATEIYWMKDNKPVPDSSILHKNGTLMIPRFTLKDLGVYVCHVRNPRRSLTAQTTLNLHNPLKSCSAMKGNFSMMLSGNYLISPDGSSPFRVYCDMTDKGGVGVTVISHDSEARTLVNGFEGAGSYKRDIHYTGVTMSQVAALTKVSQSCEQFVNYECQGDAGLIADGSGWWVSRDNVKQNYWGGATPGSGKCACGMTKSCQRQPGGCNCNNVGTHREWHNDAGLLTDKSTLPVTQLRFGDTGDSRERAYHTLGKLKCYGIL